MIPYPARAKQGLRPTSAIWKLKEAGKVVVPITGRPAGWCDHIARMRPVDAIVGENGAFYFMMKEGGVMQKRYTADKSWREEFKRGLEKIRSEIPLRGPICGHIQRPGLSGVRARHRFLRGHPPALRGRYRNGRGDIQAAWGHDQDQLHPHQRMVRRLQQAHHCQDICKKRTRDRGRKGKQAVHFLRRLPQRRNRCSISST